MGIYLDLHRQGLFRNQKELLNALSEIEKDLGIFRKALGKKNTRAIKKFIGQANRGSQKISP